MFLGTVILMKKNETFITQSMLSSYMAIETKDYLELLLPFVSVCLPEKIGERIELEQVQYALKEKYGLNIPEKVIAKLLIRLCKRKRGALVKRKQEEYSVNQVYDAKDFDERTEKIKQCIDSVLRKMLKFMNTQKYLSGVTYDKMKEYLTVFLETYNYSVYEDAQSLEAVTLERKAESNYYVAQFILSEYESDTLEFQYILEIIKGSLIAKSIYYFMNSENDMSAKRIHGTKFILDTRVLIDALGLNLPQESKATREMLELITSNGGKLATYDYYIDELRGILHRYGKSIESRLTLSLDYFIKNRYSSEDAFAYASTIEDRLAEWDIDVIEKPSYESNMREQTWHIDYNKLRDALDAEIDYRSKNGDYYSEALIRDADTIEAVAYERGANRPYSVFDCKIIFVTKNVDICKVVYSLFKEDRFKRGEVSYSITDVDLTSIIWLSTFGTKSDLPKLKLLEHAYSACAPSRTVMKEFLAKLHALEDSEKISQDMAVLLRSQYATVNDLSEITHNVEGGITDETIYEMERRLNNRADKEAKVHYKKEFEENEKVKQEIEADRFAIQQRRDELIGEQRKTSKMKQDAEYVIKVLDRKRKLFSEEKDINDQKLEAIKKTQKAIIERGKKKAHFSKKMTIGILYVLLIIIALFITLLFAFATWKISDLTNASLMLSYLFVGIVSVFSLIITVVSIVKCIGVYISKIGERVYDISYSNYIKKYRDILE